MDRAKKAASIIMVHNQPFGEMEPSEYDLDATDRMIQVGRILDIHVMDHLIISERQYHGYYSFADYRVMDRLRKSIKYIPSFELKEQFEKKFDCIQKSFKKNLNYLKNKAKKKII
ncbi:JAB domain-containing protein [Candidatus Cardinium hertigii]|uniref:JAB domain-containing protein n=1 Tax=Candidatus Cardinium hertigii TaxID=247481 RepID=UPI003D7D1D50